MNTDNNNKRVIKKTEKLIDYETANQKRKETREKTETIKQQDKQHIGKG